MLNYKLQYLIDHHKDLLKSLQATTNGDILDTAAQKIIESLYDYIVSSTGKLQSPEEYEKLAEECYEGGIVDSFERIYRLRQPDNASSDADIEKWPGFSMLVKLRDVIGFRGCHSTKLAFRLSNSPSFQASLAMSLKKFANQDLLSSEDEFKIGVDITNQVYRNDMAPISVAELRGLGYIAMLEKFLLVSKYMP